MQRYRITFWRGVWKSTSYILEAASPVDAMEAFDEGEGEFEDTEIHDIECPVDTDVDIEEI